MGNKVTHTKSKDAKETAPWLKRFLPPFQKVKKDLHRQLKEVHQSVSGSANGHQYRTKSCSASNRRTATATVQSGFPEQWWACALECYCYLRNVHDHMAVARQHMRTCWCEFRRIFDPVRSQSQPQAHLPKIRQGCINLANRSFRNLHGICIACGCGRGRVFRFCNYLYVLRVQPGEYD